MMVHAAILDGRSAEPVQRLRDVFRGTPAGDALEQTEHVDRAWDPSIRHLGAKPLRDQGTRCDAVRSSDREVRPEHSVLGRPTGVEKRLVRSARDLGERLGAGRQTDPQRPRSPSRGEGTGAREFDLERTSGGTRCARDGLPRPVDPVSWGRTEEAQGQVQAVEAHPAEVAGARRKRHRPDSLDDRFDLGGGFGRQRDRDE